jgi:WD40 repeat protein
MIFLRDARVESYPRTHKFPLLSAHSDGFIRIWDAYEGQLMQEISCEMPEGEGLTCISANTFGTALVVGGSQGHVRVFDVKLGEEFDCLNVQLKARTLWKAHLTCVAR